MSIVYSITKSKDTYSLEVSQVTNFKLYYISDNNNELISEQTLLSNSNTKLNTLKDGTYLLKLNAENNQEVTEKIEVIKYLQNSIVEDINNILCNNCDDCNSSNSSGNCSDISLQDQKILKNQNIFNKILTYQNLYISKYKQDFSLIFSKYLENATILNNYSIQNAVNKITTSERILGSSKYNEKLLKNYLYIYWAGIYFIEESIVNKDSSIEEQFLLDKFKYNTIINCSSGLCLNIDSLKNIFHSTVNINKIYSFQFESTSKNIHDVFDTPYKLTEHSEEQMLSGVDISYNKIGRIGFKIENGKRNPYTIKDVLGSDITESSFDYLYQGGISYYVSKDYISISTVFFKFTKNI